MLQVGCQHGPGGASDPGLSMPETRTHFGAWAIVSSPLTLSHDVNNETVTNQIWDIITNTEVLEVNQDYEGVSGGVYDQSSEMIELTDAFIEMNEDEDVISTPTYQYLYKPISNHRVAVLLLNSGSSTETLEINFKDIPNWNKMNCKVRDIWNHQDLGSFTNTWSTSVASHDAAFVVLS
jgi:alpha-galactosidase